MSHAPGHIRDAFLELVEEHGCHLKDVPLAAAAPVEAWDERPWSVRRLAGRLWNCSDIMPSVYCSELDMPSGSTYAQAVRQAWPSLRP